MKELRAKIADLEQEIDALKNQNKRILECAAIEKEALETLAQKAQLYFNNADLGYIILDKHQRIVEVNETFTTLLGYSKEEVLNLFFSHFFTAQKRYDKWLKEHFVRCDFENVCNLEYRLRKKNRLTFWAELFGRKFVDEGVDFTIWSVRDISLRVKSRTIIAKLNLKYQKQLRDIETMLDIIPIPVFIKDRNFKYIGCSRAFYNFFGLGKEQVLGKTVFDLYPIEIANRIQSKDEEMIEKSFQVFKITTPTPSYDKEVTIEVQKKQMMRNNEFDGFVGVYIDMTEAEKQEHYLQNQISEEVKKNLKMQTIYQDEMIRNAKFSAIGQMAAGITHEINTPLTYVKGNFEMLVEDIDSLLPESPRKNLMLKDTKTIKDGIERIESIIETMREISQKSGEQEEKANLYETLISALYLAHNRAKQVVDIMIDNVLFEPSMSKHQKHYECYLQKQRIEQVWIVILNNALDELVKIESFQNRKLCIETFERDGSVVVRFCDNAGGIDAQILPRIFEPFESTKLSSGIGIGLNIAHRIVTQNKGTLVAYNEEEGAVFEVSIPLAKKPL